MISRKMKNAEIFRDTQIRYSTDEELLKATDFSIEHQKFISESESVGLPMPHKSEKAQVIVSSKRSLDAAEPYARQGKCVCVLNFASATTPGGGVIRGSSAQEECICRCSTLYPCLNSSMPWKSFYMPHRRAKTAIYNNDCIYTPSVCVFKSDTSYPIPLVKDRWWNINIITCAAPNLRSAGNIEFAELEKILTLRIRRIFEVAVANKNTVLILGAFGCGAFENPPELVAKVFKKVMQDFIYYFDVIEYAVYQGTDKEYRNLKAFRETF